MRSYRPASQSRNFNTLSLVLKTSRPDNLLFFQGSNTTVRPAGLPPARVLSQVLPVHVRCAQVDFLALETRAGTVSLLWDLGSGSSRLDFPGLDIANNRWTRINATR